MKALPITDYTLSTALGSGRQPNLEALQQSTSGLKPNRFPGSDGLNTWIGQVADVDTQTLPAQLASFDCRNNRLAWLALQQDGFIDSVNGAIERYGADRVAVFMGTSTAGILNTEEAYRQFGEDEIFPEWYNYAGSHNTYSIAEFTRQALGLKGISSAISTACSSSAKVFASAQRAMAAGLCDAAVVGGVDSLCLTTLYGFNSLQLVAEDVCRPSDGERQGLSIGEAAGFALVERDGSSESMQLLGFGESSDAYHMSSPHPEGDGAFHAMQEALNRAGAAPESVDYINLHGTGTPSNDLSESRAVCRLFGSELACSSTKGWTGHTLGAAGIIEAIFSLMAIEHDFIPCSLNTRDIDADIHCDIVLSNRNQTVKRVMSNSFGFGGSNCSLLLGQGGAA